MKFDLHSELADQVTIENIKWHIQSLEEDVAKSAIDEDDKQFYNRTLDALHVSLAYFGGP